MWNQKMARKAAISMNPERLRFVTKLFFAGLANRALGTSDPGKDYKALA
jgi:hypothetical protein